MNIVAIGDIGVVDGMMHIGDEAMFEAFLDAAKARGIHSIVGISANPAESAARYGIGSIHPIGFTGTRDAMAQRMATVLSAAADDRSALAAEDPAVAVIDAITASDLVVVTGAGNLASNWPLHIFERATIAKIAEGANVPFVVTGQTIGPFLTEEDAVMVRAMLGSAKLVGLRESASFELVRGLDIGHDAIEQTVDDASFLAIDDSRAPSEGHRDDDAGDDDPDDDERRTGEYCLVSFSTHVGDHDRDGYLDAAARLLDEVADLGLEVLFYAHFGPLAGVAARGDVVMHEAVASRMRAESSSVPTADPRAGASLARGAALVVSSRYHPAVFAASAGVPTIGIAVDEYTTVKLSGALGNLGQDAVITAPELLAGAGPAALSVVWADRAAIRARGTSLAEERRRDTARWWDRVIGIDPAR